MLLSPVKISPLSAYKSAKSGIDKIVEDYGFLNAWSSENILVSGTTTTAYDYKGEHDLANLGASNQPTFSSSSANFNNKPTLTFDGSSDYLYKAVAGWRPSDTSGVFIGVFRIVSGAQISYLTTADEGTATQFTYNLVNTNSYRFTVRDGATNNSFRGSTVVNDATTHVISHSSTGSSYNMNIDGTAQSLTTISGANDGKWLDVINNRDNISIGALIYSGATPYGNIEWGFCGYMPFVSSTVTNNCVTALKTHYGL